MNFVALRMLTGDTAKYFGLVFAIAFCTFLLQNQSSIFANISVLDAQRSVYAAEDQLVQSERRVGVSLVAVYKSLGRTLITGRSGWRTA